MLADLDPPKVVTSAKRSALRHRPDGRLIETTRRGPRRRGMTGEDRAWLYTLAAITGLRRGELQSLTPESFSLEGNPAVVSLLAATPRIRTMRSSLFPPRRSHPCVPGWSPSPWTSRCGRSQ